MSSSDRPAVSGNVRYTIIGVAILTVVSTITVFQFDPVTEYRTVSNPSPMTTPKSRTAERTPDAVERCAVGNISAPNADSVTSVPIMVKMSNTQRIGEKIPAAL